MILLTGGTGFIGSHTAVELLQRGNDVVIVDNGSNSDPETIKSIRELGGRDVSFYEGDIRDFELLNKVFKDHQISSVIHFAGAKSVSESTEYPIRYYDNNITSTLTLLRAMDLFEVRSLVFSSSATVYGAQESMPLHEEMPLLPASNPYGLTKQLLEGILADLSAADARWSITSLRYFNPVGAHPSGLIGENPLDKPNNLMPILNASAHGECPQITIFGDDYETPDGTCIRDFIHVVDLATGHLRALDSSASGGGYHVYNLGTGRGTSVMELISTYESVTGHSLNCSVGNRRAGDVAVSYASVEKARNLLSWSPRYGLEQMCEHSWQYYRGHNI